MRRNPINVIQAHVERRIARAAQGVEARVGAWGAEATESAGTVDPATGELGKPGLFDWTLWMDFKFQ